MAADQLYVSNAEKISCTSSPTLAFAELLDPLVESFLAPPLYSRRAAFPTVSYCRVQRLTKDRLTDIWPGKSWRQSFG